MSFPLAPEELMPSWGTQLFGNTGHQAIPSRAGGPSPRHPRAGAWRGRGTVWRGVGHAGHQAPRWGGDGDATSSSAGAGPGHSGCPEADGRRSGFRRALLPRCPRGRGTAGPRSPQRRGGSRPGPQTCTLASSGSPTAAPEEQPHWDLVTGPAVPARGCAGGSAVRALGVMVAVAPRERRQERDLMPQGLRLPEALGSAGWWKRQLHASLPGGGGRLGVSQKPSFVLCF